VTKKTAVITINASWNIVNFRRSLVAALVQRGYRVVALAPQDAYSSHIAGLGAEYIPIEIDKQGQSIFRDALLLWRYFRSLKQLKPHILLAYTAKPNVYGSIAARWLGIPVINNVSGLGTAFIKHGTLTHIVSRLYKLAFRESKTVFFQNPEDRDLFLQMRLVRGYQARLLPGSGIDLMKFAPVPRPDDVERPMTFLLVARLLWDKGVGEFVEAARLVGREAPETRFQLLGFVDVPNRTAVSRHDVQAWVDEGVVEYLGEAEDVRPHIAAADCIVLPSYREGLPRTLLEGAAMGKPLIATDVPGCRHVVQDGINGFTCVVRDPRSLANAMLRLLRLPPVERQKMGVAARSKVEAEFDDKIAIARYLEAIDQALTGGL
jgi:glycosyltransferase involved in cell wall biosynthesis